MDPDVHATLEWTGQGLVFRGQTPDSPEITLDGAGANGPSPMDALLMSLAGCMAVDVRTILEKSRVDLQGLEMEIEGERAPEPPRRYTAIRMRFRFVGPTAEDEKKIQRAIELSRDTYCSVFHSLTPDLEVETDYERV